MPFPLISTLPGVVAFCDLLRSAESLEPLRFWAGQQYLQSVSLASAFAALAGRVPLGQVEDIAALMQLAHEETWGLQARNHGEAFKLFYRSLGGDVASLERTSFLPETIAAAQLRVEIAQGLSDESFHCSLQAIARANEDANLTIFAMLDKATRGDVYAGVSRIYFDCHLTDEEIHRQLLASIAAHHQPHPGEDVEATVDRLLSARNRYFDVVADHIR